jgi:hypothetical protein
LPLPAAILPPSEPILSKRFRLVKTMSAELS